MSNLRRELPVDHVDAGRNKQNEKPKPKKKYVQIVGLKLQNCNGTLNVSYRNIDAVNTTVGDTVLFCPFFSTVTLNNICYAFEKN